MNSDGNRNAGGAWWPGVFILAAAVFALGFGVCYVIHAKVQSVKTSLAMADELVALLDELKGQTLEHAGRSSKVSTLRFEEAVITIHSVTECKCHKAFSLIGDGSPSGRLLGYHRDNGKINIFFEEGPVVTIRTKSLKEVSVFEVNVDDGEVGEGA